MFNAEEWRNAPQMADGVDIETQIKMVVERIESAQIDIAPEYKEWLNVGFALADALGANGRGYYQRVSRFYKDYSASETDKQYDACLASHGHGITIASFFSLAKNAGIDIAGERRDTALDNCERQVERAPLPCLPSELTERLPPLLRDIAHCANGREDSDILVLGSIVTFSACLPNVYGVYSQREVFPNLYLFVTAQASAGKGRLSLCRRLVNPIHRQLCEASRLAWEEYNRLMQIYSTSRDKGEYERPQEPPQKMLIIPANASATSVFQILNDNDGVGLIFETEGDTLAQTFKSEHGNYSDGFRKAFHHETISYVRRRNREHVELLQPKLSALFSGTPKQVTTLIPDAENGLFSRFMFYSMPIKVEWLNVFENGDMRTLDTQFDFIAQKFLSIYNYLKKRQPIRFKFSPKQSRIFNEYFTNVTDDYSRRCGLGFLGSVRRLGLITFRIAMVLTSLRLLEIQPKSNQITCSDNDFSSALSIAKVLIEHSASVYGQLPKVQSFSQGETHKSGMSELYDALPLQFTRLDYVKTAKGINMPPATAKRHITDLVACGRIIRVQNGIYKKRDG